MAKTKLIGNYITAMNELADVMDEIKAKMSLWHEIGREEEALLSVRWQKAGAAAGALRNHFAELHRRENSPTVADRIRTLKNFKNKAELTSKRATLERAFTELEKAGVTARSEAAMSINKLAVYNLVRENLRAS